MKKKIGFLKNMFCKEEHDEECRVNAEEQRILSGQFNNIICYNGEALHQLFQNLQGKVKGEDILNFFVDIGLGLPVEIVENINDRIMFKVKECQYSLTFISVGMEYIVVAEKEDNETNYFRKTMYKYVYHANCRILTPKEFYIVYPNGQLVSTVFYGTTVNKTIHFPDFELCMSMYYRNLSKLGQELPLALYSSNIDEYLVKLTQEEAKNTDAVYQKSVQIMRLTQEEMQKEFSFTVTAQRKFSGTTILSESGG